MTIQTAVIPDVEADIRWRDTQAARQEAYDP